MQVSVVQFRPWAPPHSFSYHRIATHFALALVVTRNGSNEDIGIGCDLHRLPAQPRAAALLICSIDKEGRSAF
jgi:hypothetical protein